jgi:protein phosphatase
MALLGNRLIRDDSYDGVHELSELGRPYVLAVADGLGGQNAGEIASREVLTGFREEALGLEAGLTPTTVTLRLSEISGRIQDELIARGNANSRHRGMSTTLTAIVVYESQFFLLHAGDSRCYVLRNGVLQQATRDHTLREFSGDPSIPGNILVNCFGAEDDFFVDAKQFGSEGDAGDVFLICSDGLSDMVSDSRMEATLSQSPRLEAAGARLLELANAGGGRDNITFVIARVL